MLKIALILRRFLKQRGTLAQLVEQWTENPCVPSSNLGGTTVKGIIFIENYPLFYTLQIYFSVSFLYTIYAHTFYIESIRTPDSTPDHRYIILYMELKYPAFSIFSGSCHLAGFFICISWSFGSLVVGQISCAF